MSNSDTTKPTISATDLPDALERAILELEEDYVACYLCGGRGYTTCEDGGYYSCFACNDKRRKS